MGHPGHEIRCCRRYQHHVRPARQLDVPHARFGGFIQQIRVNGITGDCLEGQRRYESMRSARHDHTNLRSPVL